MILTMVMINFYDIWGITLISDGNCRDNSNDVSEENGYDNSHVISRDNFRDITTKTQDNS